MEEISAGTWATEKKEREMSNRRECDGRWNMLLAPPATWRNSPATDWRSQVHGGKWHGKALKKTNAPSLGQTCYMLPSCPWQATYNH